MHQPIPLKHATRLLNHGPTVLIGTSHAGRHNLMAAAWSMPVEFEPPRIAVVIDKSTFTRELLQRSGTLSIQLPCRAQADLTCSVGNSSGRDFPAVADKLAHFGVSHFPGPELGLPLVEGCVAWMECRVLDEPLAAQRYDTFFVEVVSALADPRVFAEGRWRFSADNQPLHTLHHLGAGVFVAPGDTLQAGMLPAA